MTDPVADRARRTPDAPAVIGHGARTWAEWDREIEQAATGLAALGAERIALRAEDRLRLATLALGAIRAGVTGVLVPVRWPAALASEALAFAGVDVAVSDLRVPGVPSADLAQAPRQSGAREPGALAVFTSGSTGTPKAALLSWDALVASAHGIVSHMDLREGGRWLLDLPVAHVGGLGVVIRCALAGATLAVPERRAPVAESVATLRPTHASFVATQLRRLLESEAWGQRPPPGQEGIEAVDQPVPEPLDLSSLRAILLGGSAIPADLLRLATEAGLPIATSYGLTEMGSTVTATDPARPSDVATSGRLLPGREVRIVDGEIEVRGATRFEGYLTPGGRVTPFSDAGWFATGDLGRLDDDGRLIVEGRRGLQFISGGENVQPEAIERALLALPDVAEAVVVPVADPEYGQRPVAFVRTGSGAAPDSAGLAKALRERLPGYMVPVTFHAWEGARGMKPDRQALAARCA